MHLIIFALEKSILGWSFSSTKMPSFSYLLNKNSPFSTESEVKAVLAFKGNVLEEIYDEWTRGDYSIREEYDCVIFKTISYLQKAVKLCA